MTSGAREALLDAAAHLFHDDGITATGIDAVVRAAEVTEPTLFAPVGPTSALVVAVLRRHEERRAEPDARLPLPVAEHPLAVLERLSCARGGNRGCGSLDAAAALTGSDDAAAAVVRAGKVWLRGLVTACCAAAGCRDPELAGSRLLLLLVDGAAGCALVEGRDAAPDAAVEARPAAALLVPACR